MDSTRKRSASKRAVTHREAFGELSPESQSELQAIPLTEYIDRFLDTEAVGAFEQFMVVKDKQAQPVSVIVLRLPLAVAQIAEIMAHALGELVKHGMLYGEPEDLSLPLQDEQAPESNTGPTIL